MWSIIVNIDCKECKDVDKRIYRDIESEWEGEREEEKESLQKVIRECAWEREREHFYIHKKIKWVLYVFIWQSNRQMHLLWIFMVIYESCIFLWNYVHIVHNESMYGVWWRCKRFLEVWKQMHWFYLNQRMNNAYVQIGRARWKLNDELFNDTWSNKGLRCAWLQIMKERNTTIW